MAGRKETLRQHPREVRPHGDAHMAPQRGEDNAQHLRGVPLDKLRPYPPELLQGQRPQARLLQEPPLLLHIRAGHPRMGPLRLLHQPLGKQHRRNTADRLGRHVPGQPPQQHPEPVAPRGPAERFDIHPADGAFQAVQLHRRDDPQPPLLRQHHLPGRRELQLHPLGRIHDRPRPPRRTVLGRRRPLLRPRHV